MIRKATEQDLDSIEHAYEELLDHEQKTKSTTNWKKGVYPTRETAENALEEETLWVLEDKNKVCASMVLNRDQAESYAKVDWLCKAKDDEVYVIHTLCVPPSKAGHGYGKKMVEFTVRKAEKEGCRAIRIDTWENNIPAASLYQKMGFVYRGSAEVLHRGVIPETLIHLEYVVGKKD